jgi:splicing factor 3A subunit 1
MFPNLIKYFAFLCVQVQDMEEDSDTSSSEDEDEPKKKDSGAEPYRAAPIPASAEPPREDQVIIKKGYDPKQTRGAQVEQVLRPGPKPEEYTISPITGERIPVSKLQEHMRIGLLDPRWRDQRDRQLMEKVNQESVFAAGKKTNNLGLRSLFQTSCN